MTGATKTQPLTGAGGACVEVASVHKGTVATSSHWRQHTSLWSWAHSVNVFLLALKISLLLELFSLFFSNTVAPSRLATLAAATTLLSAALYAYSCGAKITLQLALFLFGVFYTYVFAREMANSLSGFSNWFYIFGGMLASAILMASTPKADEIVTLVAKALVVFALVHAVATIIFWLVPSIYDDIVYPAFFSDTYVVESGYKSGLTNHYSTNGMYLALGVVSCTRFVFSRRYDHRPWYAALVVLMFALILTTKRAHLVFSIVAFVLAYIAQDRGTALTRYVKLGVAAVLALVVFLIAAHYIPDLLDVVERLMETTEDDSLNGRTTFYKICFDIWEEHPVFGAGWGSFSDAFFQTTTTAALSRKLRGWSHMDAHNVFIQLLAEEGLVGLVLFVAAALSAIWCAFFGARRLASASKEEAQNHVDIGLLAWSVAIQSFFLMYCITGNPLYEKIEYVPYLLALVALAPVLASRGRPSAAMAQTEELSSEGSA